MIYLWKRVILNSSVKSPDGKKNIYNRDINIGYECDIYIYVVI